MPLIVALALWLAVCFAAAGLGSIPTASTVDSWYRDLAKPSWTPLAWLFAPVWTVLYAGMAVAAWRVWSRAGLASVPIRLFLAQLALNAGWSWIFLGVQRPAILWPYLAWVSFASVLNYPVWRMNR